MRSAKPRCLGQSLYELFVALALLTILVSLALPSLAGLRLESAQATAANRLAADIAHARLEAIVRGRDVVLCPSQDGWSCASGLDWRRWISFVDLDGDRERGEHEPLLRLGEVSLATIAGSPGRSRVRFAASGSSYGSNASWTVCTAQDAKNARSLVLSNAGRLRSARGAAAAGLERCLALAP